MTIDTQRKAIAVVIRVLYETTEYLEGFLRDRLLNEDHPLNNRTLHISGTFREPEKSDIKTKKPTFTK